MKIIIFVLSLVIITYYAEAAALSGEVTGKLLWKSDKSPVEFTPVKIIESKSKKTITGGITDSLGNFIIKKVPAGNYLLKVNYIGCKETELKTIKTESSGTLNLGIIEMEECGIRTQEVVVSGMRPSYVQSIDKKIFNVGTDISSSSGSVSDLMKNIPSVDVDVEGNISLRGNDKVLVLIDGKPSILMKGTNRSNILQQLPANSIEKIEIITNPSAIYKPDGTSGIINLVTKKKKKPGINGSVNANIGKDLRYNFGSTLGINTPKFGINANYSFRRDHLDRWSYNNRTLTDADSLSPTTILQQTVGRIPTKTHAGGLSIRYNITSQDYFEGTGSFSRRTFLRRDTSNYSKFSVNSANSDTQIYDRLRRDNERQNDLESAIAYCHTFQKDRTFLADYTHSTVDEIENNHYTNSFYKPLAYETRDNTLIKQKEIENLIRAIYNDQSDEDDKWIIGYEAELDKADMRFLVENVVNGTPIKDTGKSNDYIFREQVHSIYATNERHFGRLSFLAGLRFEQSIIKSDLITLQDTVKDNYFMAFPTLHTSYKLDANNEFQLNYSLRINRPEGDDLNPFPEYQDPYNIKSGNPNLKPEKIHSIECGWEWKNDAVDMIFTPYYHYTLNKITIITYNIGNGIMKTMPENMSASDDYGFNYTVNSSFGKTFSYNFSADMYYNKIDASDIGYSKNKGAFAYLIALNADYYLTKNFILQLNNRFNSSRITPQGTINPRFITNFGAKYDLNAYNLTLTASVSDVFNSNKFITKINTPAVKQRTEARRRPRIYYFGITYRFGNNNSTKNDDEIRYEENN